MGFEQLAELRDRLRAQAAQAKPAQTKSSAGRAKKREAVEPGVEAIWRLQRHFPLAFPKARGQGSAQAGHPPGCAAASRATGNHRRTTETGHRHLVPGQPLLELYGGRCAATGSARPGCRQGNRRAGGVCAAAGVSPAARADARSAPSVHRRVAKRRPPRRRRRLKRPQLKRAPRRTDRRGRARRILARSSVAGRCGPISRTSGPVSPGLCYAIA